MTVSKPLIPKTRIGYQGSLAPRIAPSAAETVALFLGEHDWGPTWDELALLPEDTLPLASFDEWKDWFGDSDTPSRTAVALAYTGPGLQGVGGVGGIIPMRLAPSAQRASVTIQNTAGSPVTALTLTARWKGTRGNRFSVKFDADPAASSTRDRLRIYFDGALYETFIYPKTNITQLAADISSRPNFPVVPSGVVSGTALTPTAGTNMSGGTNGNALTSTDYTDAVEVLEFQRFLALGSYNLTDGPTIAALTAWAQAQDEANRPVHFAIGGGDSDTVSTALARSAANADPHVMNLGLGTYIDEVTGKTLNMAQLVPRALGVLASRGLKSAMTGALLGGLTPAGATSVSEAEAKTLADGGVTTFVRTDSTQAKLRIARGVTTFTSTTDVNRPLRIFSEPRFVRIMDDYASRMRIWGDENVIGSLPNNEDTRNAVERQGRKLLAEYQREGLILTKAQGATADPYFRVVATTDDTIPFEFGWTFTNTTNFLIGSGSVL